MLKRQMDGHIRRQNQEAERKSAGEQEDDEVKGKTRTSKSATRRATAQGLREAIPARGGRDRKARHEGTTREGHRRHP